MDINEFGIEIRKARNHTGEKLRTMSKALKISIAFLSSIETGRSKIPLYLIPKIEKYFNKLGYTTNELMIKAIIANDTIHMYRMAKNKKYILAKLASTSLTNEQVAKIKDIIK